MAIRAVQRPGVSGGDADLANHDLASLGSQGRQDGAQIYTRTSFFFACRFVLPGIWGIAALTVLAPEALAGLPHTFQEQDASLYAMPVFLGQFVPVGLMGLLLAAMLAADMSSTSSYMITWASVIYNDILAPFRKTPWSEKRGLLWNRVIVSLIGVFLLLYGLWYPLKGDVYAYLLVTGAIYLASISTMLIACCYWKRANSWGATGAIIVGLPFPSPAWCSSKCGACLRTRCTLAVLLGYWHLRGYRIRYGLVFPAKTANGSAVMVRRVLITHAGGISPIQNHPEERANLAGPPQSDRLS